MTVAKKRWLQIQGPAYASRCDRYGLSALPPPSVDTRRTVRSGPVNESIDGTDLICPSSRMLSQLANAMATSSGCNTPLGD